MPFMLSPAALASSFGAEHLRARLPVPSRLVSNGEHSPRRQTPRQRRYEAAVVARAERLAPARGLTPGAWLRTPSGMAAAFAALNEASGTPVFAVSPDEVEDAAAAEARRARLSGQFVFDDHVHFLRDDADPAAFESLDFMLGLAAELLDLRESRAGLLDQVKFVHFVKEVFLDSDTKVALLSGAPSDSDAGWMLTNDQMAAAKRVVNAACGSRRLLTHAVFNPGSPGWLDEIDRVHATLRPDGWKGYTIGEAFAPSAYRWRMDDEALVYPAYERMLKAGVTTVCVHKGLLPDDAEAVLPGGEPYARVDDVPKACLDWPELKFVIYHAGYRTVPSPTGDEVERFERTGEIDWVSQLARMPAEHGLTNLYADIGASFAFTVLTHPRLAAGMLGTLVKGLGSDHVFWGTDSVWYGSPQWQIEAFRRIEIPEDLQARFGWAPLGSDDGPVKRGVLGRNAAPFYALDPAGYEGPPALDDLASLRARYLAEGGGPSNQAFGYATDAAR